MGEAVLERASGAARALAGLIALAACAGIGVHFGIIASGPASWPGTIWILLAYFTITTNLLVAVVFTGIALDAAMFRSPALLGGTTLSILLVGVVYGLLLRGLQELTAGSQFANFLLHQLTPVLAPVYWLGFSRKGALGWRDPLLWTLYPFGYFLYAAARGVIGGRYPYPFMDVLEIGWPQTLLNVALIALGFILAGWALVWLDHWLARARP
ncbi:MAG: hypothetical protein K0R27_3126 [Xanthobacteraceae bacterium]|jgi:hypothetical protein|nr:hypothetical protein [Xanthobacteraceae bacterium]